MKRVAVEPTLANIRAALAERGYQVVPLEEGRLPTDADAVVIAGTDKNLMGIQTTGGYRGPVINAAGLTAAEVVREVERRTEGVG